MPLILRLIKGSKLTFTELDGNFVFLSSLIEAENDRATTAENELSQQIIDLDASVNENFTNLHGQISAETQRAELAEEVLGENIQALSIESLATPSNESFIII